MDEQPPGRSLQLRPHFVRRSTRAAWASAAAAIALVTLGATCGSSAAPDPGLTPRSSTPRPSLWDPIAQNLTDATSLVRERLTAQPGISGEPQSIYYVQTTVGRARDLFDPGRQEKLWITPDDAVAWVFVAYGQFQLTSIHGSDATFATVWIVIPRGDGGMFWAGSDQVYDLTRLGEAIGQIAAPLPPWPTPVSLGSATPEPPRTSP